MNLPKKLRKVLSAFLALLFSFYGVPAPVFAQQQGTTTSEEDQFSNYVTSLKAASEEGEVDGATSEEDDLKS